MCRSRKKVHGLAQEEEHERDLGLTLLVGTVTTEVQIKNDECYVMLPIQGHITKLKVDTGSQINIMPFKELRKIAGSSPNIESCTYKLVGYSDDKLSVLGTVKLPVKSRWSAGVEQELTFHIVETN